MASNKPLSGKGSASAIFEPWRHSWRSSSPHSPCSSCESLELAQATEFGKRGRQTSLSSNASGDSASTTTKTASWMRSAPSPDRLTRNGSVLRSFYNTENARCAQATDEYKEAELGFKIWLLESVIKHHNLVTSHFAMSRLEEMVENTVEKREALKAGGVLDMKQIQALVAEAVNAGVKLGFIKFDLLAAIKQRRFVSDTWFTGSNHKASHDQWTNCLEMELQKLEWKVPIAVPVPAPVPALLLPTSKVS